MLGEIPDADIDIQGGEQLVEVLFKIGPAKADAPLGEADLEPYERRRGIEFAPWQAELLVEMSKAYMHEAHAAREYNAPPPIKQAAPMWRYVRNTLAERTWDKVKPQKEKADGPRKRHRN